MNGSLDLPLNALEVSVILCVGNVILHKFRPKYTTLSLSTFPVLHLENFVATKCTEFPYTSASCEIYCLHINKKKLM